MARLHHIQYVDSIKGIAIISVIVLHALPRQYLEYSFAQLHIWQAVPLFVFVSFFLLFRKMKQTTISHYYTKKSISKLIKRIVIPFLLVQLFFIAYAIIRQDFTALKAIITHGGWGMGSYYPYIYLQIWLFAPLLYCLLKKRFGWIVVFALALGLNALFFKIGGVICMKPIESIPFCSSAIFHWL